MKLKGKIINKAIELFHENGISNVSPNQIAAELSISTGALTYHFKTKANLIKEIYEQMDLDSKDFLKMKDRYLSLDDFRRVIQSFRDFMAKHSFFFNDLVFILRNYPEVDELYKRTNLRRLKEGRSLFEHYVQTGRMIPETDGINYDNFVHNVWMVSAFWNSQTRIFNSSEIFNKPIDLVDMTWYMILPYLTEKGKEEYNQINNFLNN